ncbi:hypothetical protein, unlikely [Trypanosoma brucei gambiense DAL972]|uniref:Uncharacterized protein n=2 Tax=Trypanosoma brucei TaxID=5691 RepID=C9ZHY3_TRYB9|nr:hypothetical protein, unlikely [Trypanosoma brucei gambiense DAL972]RHW74200.1 hypothetical protein DPX39_010040800 [Trypanosoma brucei equiperdum]CBH09100.1 hypothetical protein, unlikely [Trypanosoma brucei gambiense DAL972]|eukprot:XP_011771541.1 hypothetical protein, unlikely [Trypanosoma brucei gambiense DAL972]
MDEWIGRQKERNLKKCLNNLRRRKKLTIKNEEEERREERRRRKRKVGSGPKACGAILQ